ncbi:hypothetical protein LSAT2_014682 [Lamellibrachia satsuma]|nr:hypothetical protein LSAT2_014682 [Lamellibrachia satsuma]
MITPVLLHKPLRMITPVLLHKPLRMITPVLLHKPLRMITPVLLHKPLRMITPVLLHKPLRMITPVLLHKLLRMITPVLLRQPLRMITSVLLRQPLRMITPVLLCQPLRMITPVLLRQPLKMITPVLLRQPLRMITPVLLRQPLRMITPVLLHKPLRMITPVLLHKPLRMITPVLLNKPLRMITPVLLHKPLRMITPVLLRQLLRMITPVLLRQPLRMITPVLLRQPLRMITPVLLHKPLRMITPVLLHKPLRMITPVLLHKPLRMITLVLLHKPLRMITLVLLRNIGDYVLYPPIRVESDDEDKLYRQLASSGGLDDVDDEKRHMTPMKQIESARAQWRKEEQSHLEESWTSLNMFDRSQRGRISLDFQKDILDEYLMSDRINMPHEETIPEEDESNNAVLDRDEFVIPELPRGQHLVIDILTTWGDRYYVGLNGIEIFSNTGEPVTVTKITADPADINVLPEYTKDPRVVTNLIDGVNRTRDDTHLWLTPFTKGRRHCIELTFDQPAHIAMMRIWNYNKSRIHSYRGVRDIEMTLDGFMIFKGEITRACGDIVGGSEAFGETILFTMDEDMLEAVSLHDQAFRTDFLLDEDDTLGEACGRPKTADQEEQGRPYTTASKTRLAVVSNESAEETDQMDSCPPQPLMQAVLDGDSLVMKGQCLKLNFTATWGDPHYLGLSGLEVVGRVGEALPVSLAMLDADPHDLHVLPGYETDDRTLDKLIDDTNITTSDEHMWLVPFTEGESHWITVTFDQATDMTGLRIWNYNKSSEDTYRGARIIHVTLDGRQVSPSDGYLVRKGSGNCYFDFAQEISFTQPQYQPTVAPSTPGTLGCLQQSLAVSATGSAAVKASQEYEAVQMPRGFIYQFHLLCTWGDPYYVGLCSLDFYDSEGNHIDLTETNIAAYPNSVNVLDSVENDMRTPDKLIDGINDTTDGCHMWLAPILPGILNRVYVIFDQPIEVSMIKICNYSKTPTRGVKDFALLVDDLLVYNGTLEMSSRATHGILPTCPASQPYHTILFTDDKAIQRRERHTIIRNQAGDQDVQLMNDREVVAHYTDPKKAHGGKPVDQAKRPMTSVTGRGSRRR